MNDPAKPVDWCYIICRLQRVGMDLEQQALEVGCSTRQINRYKAGDHEPSYTRGSKLLSIYQTVYRTTK